MIKIVGVVFASMFLLYWMFMSRYGERGEYSMRGFYFIKTKEDLYLFMGLICFVTNLFWTFY